MATKMEGIGNQGNSTLPHINMRILKSDIPKEDLATLNLQDMPSGFNSSMTKDVDRPVISPTRPLNRHDLKSVAQNEMSNKSSIL